MESDGEKQEVKKAKNLKGSKSTERAFILWSFMLFLTKEMDANCSGCGGNT